MVRATIPETLTPLAVPIDGLQPYGRNPRRGNVDVIVDSLKHHGQYRPIVVRAKTFEVLAGNHTLAAAKELGWDQIAATFVDVDDDEAARIVLVDNRAADLGSYEDEVLAELLAGLGDPDGTGYTPDDVADILAKVTASDLDALEAQYGEPKDDDLWLSISMKVPPDVHRQFYDALGAEDGDTEPERLVQLLNRAQVRESA